MNPTSFSPKPPQPIKWSRNYEIWGFFAVPGSLCWLGTRAEQPVSSCAGVYWPEVWLSRGNTLATCLKRRHKSFMLNRSLVMNYLWTGRCSQEPVLATGACYSSCGSTALGRPELSSPAAKSCCFGVAGLQPLPCAWMFFWVCYCWRGAGFTLLTPSAPVLRFVCLIAVVFFLFPT